MKNEMKNEVLSCFIIIIGWICMNNVMWMCVWVCAP